MRDDRIRSIFRDRRLPRYYDWLAQDGGGDEVVVRHPDPIIVDVEYLPLRSLAIVRLYTPDDYVGPIRHAFPWSKRYQVLVDVTAAAAIRHGIGVLDSAVSTAERLSPCTPDMEGQTRPYKPSEETGEVVPD